MPPLILTWLVEEKSQISEHVSIFPNNCLFHVLEAPPTLKLPCTLILPGSKVPGPMLLAGCPGSAAWAAGSRAMSIAAASIADNAFLFT